MSAENRLSKREVGKENVLKLVVRVGKSFRRSSGKKKWAELYCLFLAFGLLLRTATDELITFNARQVRFL